MGTTGVKDSLSLVLFGKTRRAVLALLFSHPEKSFYLREVVRAAGVGQGAVQRELQRLSQAGIVLRSTRGQQVHFQANTDCPVFSELRGIILKTAGVADVLREALNPLAGRIRFAFIYGSVARGEPRQGSDVDLCVVGEATFAEVVAVLGVSEEKLKREVNPTVYPLAEFECKLAAGHHFLVSVVRGPKLFLIGDEGELAGMAEKWLVGFSRKQSP